MKIRQPIVIQVFCILAFWLLRALFTTVPYRYWRNSQDLTPGMQDKSKSYIYAMWHENMLVPLCIFSHSSLRILISQHTDGMMVAEVCKHLRMGFVRGSSTRGGVEAIRKLLRPGRFRHLALTPDGPRGPRRQVQLGIVYLAARLGWPIVAVGIGHDRPWRLRSWDRFAIPRPFCRADIVASEPIVIPPDLDRAGLAQYRQFVEDELNAVTEKAELAARTGKRPTFDLTPRQPIQTTAAA